MMSLCYYDNVVADIGYDTHTHTYIVCDCVNVHVCVKKNCPGIYMHSKMQCFKLKEQIFCGQNSFNSLITTIGRKTSLFNNWF